MDFKDYYSTLGVAKTATEKEIKQAYRKLARKHHPDVNPGDKSAEARFKEINEAYEVLGDPDKRKKYDELGANWRMYEQAGAGRRGFDPRQAAAWNVNFGGGGAGRRLPHDDRGRDARDVRGRRTRSRISSRPSSAAAGGADEPRRRARGARGARAHAPGRDVEHELELGLEDAYHGTMRRLLDSSTTATRARSTCGFRRASATDRACASAAKANTGAAARSRATCICGSGWRRIRSSSARAAICYTRVPIPLTTAVLGGEAEVQTLGGKSLRLKIPPTTQNGQVFRLKGHGMPVTGKPDEHGDLYATVDVQLPRS